MIQLIHPSAIIDPRAEIDSAVEIGPYAIIGAGVSIGRGTRILAHAVIEGPMSMGESNLVYPFCAIGLAPQHKKNQGDGARLEIGNRNVIREHVTIHRGTERDGIEGTTRIGDDNLLMCASHVAHDVHLGSCCTLSNGVQIAGHAIIENYVTFGGLSGVAQFVRIGQSAFVAAGSMCEKDVPPFVIVQGDRARIRALNKVGLRRRGIASDSIKRLEDAFRVLFARNVPRKLAIESMIQLIEKSPVKDPYVQALVEAMKHPEER